MKNRTFPLTILSLALLFSACSTTNLQERGRLASPQVLPLEVLCPENPQWENLLENDDSLQVTGFRIKSLGVSWHCVKIDLQAHDWQIEPFQIIEKRPSLTAALTAQHPSETPAAPTAIWKSFSVKKEAKKQGALVAFNTNPFGKEPRAIGIIKSNGKVISPAEKKYAALCFSAASVDFETVDTAGIGKVSTDIALQTAVPSVKTAVKTTASIIQNQNEEELEKYDSAFGGFFQILKDGEIIEFQKIKRPRTGAGIDQSGRFLFIMVTAPIFRLNARNGLNYEECAAILKKLGCQNAMQFDGGHSAALVVLGRDLEKPFMQRQVPCAVFIRMCETN